MVVRIGGEHHVRAIRQVNEKGELLFFSAIDEGMVLTVARSQDMVQNLESMLDNLSNPQRPASILTCDCLLRRIEAERGQATTALSDVMSRNNIVGFSTYGEQIGALHVNQTMTGVAIYTDEP